MNLKLMKNLCLMSKDELEKYLVLFLKEHGYKVLNKGYYMLGEPATGDCPVVVHAHIDTVFMDAPKKIYYDNRERVMWSPNGLGADDRAGIYAVLDMILFGFRPCVIFTDLEEYGGIGSSLLVSRFKENPFNNTCYLISFDRQGENDCVFYDCENNLFQQYVESYGYKTAEGTFSDISILAPMWKIAGVNLSVGYENEHTEIEILHTDWLDRSIEKARKMLMESKETSFFHYISSTPTYGIKQLVLSNVEAFSEI